MSEFLKINILDLVKGSVVAAFTAALVLLKDMLSTGTLTFNWPAMASAALTAAVAYLLKNLLTNKDGELFKK